MACRNMQGLTEPAPRFYRRGNIHFSVKILVLYLLIPAVIYAAKADTVDSLPDVHAPIPRLPFWFDAQDAAQAQSRFGARMDQ
jgi:hypothetical protein